MMLRGQLKKIQTGTHSKRLKHEFTQSILRILIQVNLLQLHLNL